MIDDLTDTLGGLLSQPGVPAELAAAQIIFDPPRDPFTPAQTSVDVFLFDIRENVNLRFTEFERRTVGQVVFEARPPMRVSCSYLITAWPSAGQDIVFAEHLLVSQVLQVLAGFPLIPAGLLKGKLIGQEPPVQLQIAHPDDMRNPSEFWAAVGNRIRPAVVAAATITMPIFAEEQSPLVITSDLALQQIGVPGTRQEMFRIGGHVTDAANAPVAGATVRVVGRGRATATDGEGAFTLSPYPAGSYTLRVVSGGTQVDVGITIPAPLGSNYDVQLP